MKNSGIEWIGEIPYSWQIKSVKNEFTRKQSQSSNLENNILTLARSGVKVRDISTGEGQIASDYSNYNYVTPGDLLLNPMDLVSGDNCNISNFYGVISPAYFNLGVKNHANPYFFNYYFKIQYWIGSFFAHGKGVSFENRWTLNYETLRNFPILFPPLNEQQKIVKFLDDNLSYINSFTEQTYQSINELKKYKQSLITEAVTKGLDSTVEMKDSGIEPMMNVPKHWKINKIKYLFELYRGLNITKKNLIDTGIPVINYGEIHSKYGFHFDLRYDVVQKVDSHYLEYKNSLINQGDFIFADTSEDIEGSGNFTCYLNEEMCFSGSHTIILKPKKFINYFYFSYLFESLLFRSQIQKKVEGIKVYSITQRILKSLILFEPPAKEQEQIVQYLDNKISTIDRLIEDKTKVIAELENYKKSLIYEYVTGKKEV